MTAIRSGFIVYNRSIFDTVSDFLQDEPMDGHEKVLQRYLTLDVLIVDDIGMKQLPKWSGEFLFELAMRRHEVNATAMTSNRRLEETGKTVGDVASAAAMPDRFLHHAGLIQITDRNYRLEDREEAPRETKASTGSAAIEKIGS